MTKPQRRAHVRKRAELDLECSLGDEVFKARSQNMSLGGAFIVTDSSLSFGQDIEVALRFPGFNELRRIPATVRWAGPNGIGLQFGALDAQTTYELTEYLAQCAEGD